MAKIEQFLDDYRRRGRRYFTLDELVESMHLSREASLAAIYRLKSKGKIMSPAKGLYVMISPQDRSVGSIPEEQLIPIMMGYLSVPYYVSLLSAAQYYGASHQKPARFQIVSSKRFKKRLVFGQASIETFYKKNLSNLPTRDNVVATGYLKIATPELVVFDMFMYRDAVGGFNRIATVLSELTGELGAEKLIELAQLLKNKSWVQRLGYILEVIKPFDERNAQKIINALQVYVAKNVKSYIRLAPERPVKGFPHIRKWMLIANTEVESDI